MPMTAMGSHTFVAGVSGGRYIATEFGFHLAWVVRFWSGVPQRGVLPKQPLDSGAPPVHIRRPWSGQVLLSRHKRNHLPGLTALCWAACTCDITEGRSISEVADLDGDDGGVSDLHLYGSHFATDPADAACFRGRDHCLLAALHLDLHMICPDKPPGHSHTLQQTGINDACLIRKEVQHC